MSEEAKEREDRLWRTLAPALTLIGIVVGVWQFNTGEEHRRVAAEKAVTQQNTTEFERRLWLDKVEAYQKVAELTGRVIASQDAGVAERDAAYRAFVSAYWGAMILVEDRSVADAMQRFYLDLIDLRSGWQTDPSVLKDHADALLKACRQGIESGAPGVRTAAAGRPGSGAGPSSATPP
jgi:hypothetical protein